MTPEEVVRAQLDAWSRLDVDEIMGYFAPDAVWDFVPFGPVSGHDAIRKALTGYLSKTTSAEVEILNLAVAQNMVLTERVDHFLWDGETFDTRIMGAFEVTGDKITAWRDYFDMSRGGH
jgi:limonene-1,2-epoxide hydrolase